MKVLLTGDHGYIGSRFKAKYNDVFEIVGFDLASGDDLLNLDKLKQKMQGCTQVVHLAAIPAPVEGKSFSDYMSTNVDTTRNVALAAEACEVKRVIYGSSTTIYGIEQGIPFAKTISEDLPLISQYITAEQLSCREVDLSYHMSKAMCEQVMAWYGLNKKFETICLRFGPVNKVFLGTSVSEENAINAIKLAIDSEKEFWFKPYSIVDQVDHIDISKARNDLGYVPAPTSYSGDQIHSQLSAKS